VFKRLVAFSVTMALPLQSVAAQTGVKWVPLNGQPTHPVVVAVPAPTPIPAGSRENSANATSSIPDDLALLQGKTVIVGRLPLCVPNTYQPNLAYAGKAARVIELKRDRALTNLSTANLPPNSRAMVENLKKGGLLVLQFEDGTKLDTCAPQGSDQLSSNLEVAPGETVTVSTSTPSSDMTRSIGTNVYATPEARFAAAPQSCPMAVIKASSGYSFGHMLVDVLTTSELQRQIDEVNHGGVEKHYLDVQVRNDSGKPVRAFEFSAAYSDRMGDESTSASFVSQNNKPIRAGDVYKTSAMDREFMMQNGRGDVTLYIARVRFEDDTQWQDNGSRSCGLKAALR